MSPENLTIGLIRRGYSSTGGAESYLKRLARGLSERGHRADLFTTADWPANEWSAGRITRTVHSSALGFADEIEKLEPRRTCDVVLSLERVWACDVFRAGDGVHASWLQRRSQAGGRLAGLARAVNRKHREILRLEEALLRQRGARRVIANSKMVKDEIARFYDYPLERIEVVRNGVPLAAFRSSSSEERTPSRQRLGLATDDVAVLFVGSGWERKGLATAAAAVAACDDRRLRLLVAGHGAEAKYRSKAVQFLGAVPELPPIYRAADIFLLPTSYDPFSNACLEALAAGLPVVTTSANGFSEIIRDAINGSIIADPRDVEATRDALRFWLGPGRRETARSANSELARDFDISRNVDETLRILLQPSARAASTSG